MTLWEIIMITNRTFLQSCMLSFLLPFTALNAEIILHGTRVVYSADAREVTLQMSNVGEKPSLIQAWIDEGDAKSTPDQSKAPFMITPPISRVNPQKGQSLRITALPNAESLSQTQETLYWLNVLDIPPKPDSQEANADDLENYVQLAIRSRIKLFYRPKGLKQAHLAPEKIQWIRTGSKLTVKNPTPFYITVTSILQGQPGKEIDLLPSGLLLKPFAEEAVDIQTSGSGKMIFTTINDYGSRVEYDFKTQ